MGEGALLVFFVAAQRLAELAWAERNRRRLMAVGAIEFGRAHYPAIIALHVAWLAAMFVLGRDRTVDPTLFAAFVMVQVVRVWILISLRGRWTTRIIVLPGRRLIAAGPYRFMRHPNYLVVALEIAIVPLMLGLAGTALTFSLTNAALLWRRIRAENAALDGAAPPDRARSLANGG